MYSEPFHQHFEDVARRETRFITLMDGAPGELPADEYALFEAYCTDPSCDCRRVILMVIGRNQGQAATISFGFDRNDPMSGPFLDPMNPQGRHAAELLELVRDLALSDAVYVARLERHYRMMKDKFAQPAPKERWWKKRKKPKRNPPHQRG
jgi:hypothetical protein